MSEDTCPSEWTLERYLLGELPVATSEVIEHIAICAACQAKIAAKEADGAAFMSSPAADEIRRALRGGRERAARRGLRAVPRWALGGLAAAAAVALTFALLRGDAASRGGRPLAADEEEQIVLRFQREWMQAVCDKDTAALDRILADEYTYTDARGRVSGKSESLQQSRKEGDALRGFATSETKARVYGDVAVITGRLKVEGVSGSKPFEDEVQFTDTLARIDGRWRAVAAHVSRPMAPPRPE